jgi:hypothetical protein
MLVFVMQTWFGVSQFLHAFVIAAPYLLTKLALAVIAFPQVLVPNIIILLAIAVLDGHGAQLLKHVFVLLKIVLVQLEKYLILQVYAFLAVESLAQLQQR